MRDAQEAERRNADAWRRANDALRRAAAASGVATTPEQAARESRRNSAIGNAGIGAAGAPAAPLAQAQNTRFPAGGPVAQLRAPVGAPPFQARPPVAPLGGPGVGPAAWTARPPNAGGLNRVGRTAAGLNPVGRTGPARAGVPPIAAGNGNSALGFGGDRAGAGAPPRGVGGGVNARGQSLGQGAHLQLEMLRLEKERERLLLEQEVEMLRLENEIRERGMQLMQRETVLGGAEAINALYAGAAGEARAARLRVPALLDNLIDGDGSGVAPPAPAVAGNNRAPPRRSEVIELGDSSDEDEGTGKSKDSDPAPSLEINARSTQPNQVDIGTGDSSLANDRSVHPAHLLNEATEKVADRATARRRDTTVPSEGLTEKTEKQTEQSLRDSDDGDSLTKISSKKRLGEEISALESDEDIDDLPILHAYKNRRRGKNKATETTTTTPKEKCSEGGLNRSSSASSSDPGEPQGIKTGTRPTKDGSRLFSKDNSTGNTDDDSVVVVETADVKTNQEASGTAENSEEQLWGQTTATTSNSHFVGSSKQPVHSDIHGIRVTIHGRDLQGGSARPAIAQASALESEAPTTQPEVKPLDSEQGAEKVHRDEQSQERSAEGSSEEMAIDEHCGSLQRGIKQLRDRMTRLEKYAVNLKEQRGDGGQSASRPSADVGHMAKNIEVIKEGNRRLRERAQKLSDYWKEKCQDRELHFRRLFTETDDRFKNNMAVLHERHLKDFERERESHKEGLETHIVDEPVVQKEELERRIACATLEAQALSNAAEKMSIYGKRELESLTKRLEAERESERDFHCQQKEEIRIRMKRVSREDRYFREKAMPGAGCGGPRGQSSRPLPSDVLSDNMIYLLMRDLANLEYMADFLRKKMKQDTERESESQACEP